MGKCLRGLLKSARPVIRDEMFWAFACGLLAHAGLNHAEKGPMLRVWKPYPGLIA